MRFEILLEMCPNVAKTEIKGEHKEQFNIEIDLMKLSGYNLSLDQIVGALKSLSASSPEVKNRTQEESWLSLVSKMRLSVLKIFKILLWQILEAQSYTYATLPPFIWAMTFKIKRVRRLAINKARPLPALQDQVTLSISKLKGSNAVVGC